ncbi:MAG: FecR domain-containing protein [Candidatus Ozemobacteraceae bacterium]
MKPEKNCDRFLEELSGRRGVSAEAAAHLQICPDCLAFRQKIEALCREGTAVRPSASHQAIKKAVMERILEPVCEPSNESISIRGWGSLVAVAAGLLIAIGIWLHPVDRWSGGHLSGSRGYTVIADDGTTQTFPLDRAFILGEGSARLSAPDGSVFQVVAPVEVVVETRGFVLLQGTLVASVQSGKIPFVGKTPHGQVEVLGTVFQLRVTKENSILHVLSGKVRMTSWGGVGKTFIANQSGDMLDLHNVFPRKSSKPIPSIDDEGEVKDAGSQTRRE